MCRGEPTASGIAATILFHNSAVIQTAAKEVSRSIASGTATCAINWRLGAGSNLVTSSGKSPAPGDGNPFDG